MNLLYPRVDEVPFSSERKRMTTIHKAPDESWVVYVKGSPEKVLQLSKFFYQDGKVHKLDDEAKARIIKEIEGMASEALRVLAMAYKTSKEKPIKLG